MENNLTPGEWVYSKVIGDKAKVTATTQGRLVCTINTKGAPYYIANGKLIAQSKNLLRIAQSYKTVMEKRNEQSSDEYKAVMEILNQL